MSDKKTRNNRFPWVENFNVQIGEFIQGITLCLWPDGIEKILGPALGSIKRIEKNVCGVEVIFKNPAKVVASSGWNGDAYNGGHWKLIVEVSFEVVGVKVHRKVAFHEYPHFSLEWGFCECTRVREVQK